jgi:hypothetical protein
VFADYIDDHLLAVVTEAKCETSWTRISERSEFADYIASGVKQRWQFLACGAGNEEGQSLRAHFPFGNEEDGEVDNDAFEGVGLEKVPEDDEDDEVEHENGQQDREPAAGDSADEEG